MKFDRATFDRQRDPRFGRANPERMRMPLWEAIVQDGETPYAFRQAFDLGCGGPPIWTFERMGQTRTDLPDGRTACVGGEHEDHYDPDFFIYNDVVILSEGGEVEIYGYPKGDFPPTDFHSASLVGDRLVVIGCLGYPADRRPGTTPIWTLDLATFRVDPVESRGETPGWIFKHEAEVDPSGESITVRGGEIVEERDGGQIIRLNLEEYRFHLAEGRWERITDRRGWRQFEIGRDEGGPLFDLGDPDPIDFDDPDGEAKTLAAAADRPLEKWWFDDEVFQPGGVPHEPILMEELHRFGLFIDGITIRAEVDPFRVRLIVEGVLPEGVADRAVEEIRGNIEAAIDAPCRLDGQ